MLMLRQHNNKFYQTSATADVIATATSIIITTTTIINTMFSYI